MRGGWIAGGAMVVAGAIVALAFASRPTVPKAVAPAGAAAPAGAVAPTGAVAPAVVYATGGKFDRSFNESLHQSMERFKAVTGIPYVDFEVSYDTQFEQVHRHYAAHGRDPILAVGFPQTDAVRRIAQEFPHTRFVLIDARIDRPNVQSVEFKEHEGAFLVGVLAAMASKSGKVGVVGGMDIPLIRRVVCGYAQGAKYANPRIVVFSNTAGTTSAAWTDPARGAEIARQQFDRGVDVVFAAAGTTGLGTLQAAADRGKLVIGVDSDQNYLHPGTMLTSMLKRTDIAAYKAVMSAKNGQWKSGHIVLGLKEGGVGWAYDRYNAALITPAMKTKVAHVQADIIAGKIKVHDYESDNRCDF